MDSAPLPINGLPRKRCPFCAELIPETVKKCAYCHEYLDPSLRGQYAGGAAYWDGDFLRVPLGGFIRKTHCLVCAKGGATTTTPKTFRHIPRWAWLMLILLPFLYIFLILIAITHERHEIDVPVCWDCHERWTRMSTIFRLYGVMALFAFPIVFMIVGDTLDRRDGGLYGVLAGLLVWGWGLFGLHALGVRKCQPTCRRIDKSGALLRLPNAGELQTAWESER